MNVRQTLAVAVLQELGNAITLLGLSPVTVQQAINSKMVFVRITMNVHQTKVIAVNMKCATTTMALSLVIAQLGLNSKTRCVRVSINAMKPSVAVGLAHWVRTLQHHSNVCSRGDLTAQMVFVLMLMSVKKVQHSVETCRVKT